MDATRPAAAREAKIVAAFDGSRAGFDAVALGRLLAETTGATLLVADVFPYNALFSPSVTLDPAIEACLMRAAGQRLRQVEDALAGFDRWAHHMRAALPAARALHTLAREQAAQMIVVGSSHRHGIGRVEPGATAEGLLHDARVPVLLAPAGWRHRRPDRLRTVGAGFDGSAGAVQALSAAAMLAAAMGVTLRAIAVFEPPDRALTADARRATVARMRSDLWLRLDEVVAVLPEVVDIETDLIDGDPLEILSRESSAVDVLAVGPAGAVTSALVWRSRSPLLVVAGGGEHPLDGLAGPETAAPLAAYAGSIEP
jgi:nucleotide-binding universal stress UspA family protein